MRRHRKRDVAPRERSAAEAGVRPGGRRGGRRRGLEGPRWAWLGDLGREPEVREDPADDGCDQAHAATTPRTGKDIELEGPSHQDGPPPGARFAARLALRPREARELRDTGRGEFNSGLPQRDLTAFVCDGVAAPAGMGENPW